MAAVRAPDRVGDALAAAIDALTAAGVESPRLDAEVLLAEASGNDRAALIASPEAAVDPTAARAFGEMVRRRLRREPVAYILGRRGFRDLELRVDSRVLIPRPETELLVEVGVELLAGADSAERSSRILDVGTGSGAVALALAAELPGAEVVATDTSPGALQLAAENAAGLGLGERVRFEHGMVPARADLPEAGAGGTSFDLLVANLPYIAESEWGALAPEIRDWEPREALLAGPEGLDAIRGLLDGLRARSSGGGGARDAGSPASADAGDQVVAATIALEVGEGQAVKVEELVAAAGYADIDVRADLAGIPRVVIGRR